MKVLGKASHYEAIVTHLTDPESDIANLSAKEQEMLKRWMEAFTIQRNYSSTLDTVAILMKRFPNISRATAYRDCADALSVFGDISKATKEGIRHLATEITKDAIIIAKLKNNEDGMMKGAKNIAQINGVNLTDPDMPDFAKLEPHIYTIGIPPAALQVIMDMANGGKVNLNDMVARMSDVAEEAEVQDE
jgi:hypothetical protein